MAATGAHLLDQKAEQLLDKLGLPLLTGGVELRWNCPFCERSTGSADTKQHLYYNRNKERFFCQRCTTGGTLDYFLRSQGLDATKKSGSRIEWREVVDYLIRMKLYVDRRRDIIETPSIVYPCKVKPTWKHREARKYLCGRGIPVPQQIEYDLRVGSQGYFDRIFFPTFRPGVERRELQFWVARVFPKCEEDEMKYRNPPGLSRNQYIFNLNRAEEYRHVIITEGVTSAMAIGPNAVATFGKFVSDNQVRMLASRRFDSYTVSLDGDAMDCNIALAKKLHERGCFVRVVDLPEEHDPASLPRSELNRCLDHAVEYSEAAMIRIYLERALWRKRKGSRKRLLTG